MQEQSLASVPVDRLSKLPNEVIFEVLRHFTLPERVNAVDTLLQVNRRLWSLLSLSVKVLFGKVSRHTLLFKCVLEDCMCLFHLIVSVSSKSLKLKPRLLLLAIKHRKVEFSKVLYGMYGVELSAEYHYGLLKQKYGEGLYMARFAYALGIRFGMHQLRDHSLDSPLLSYLTGYVQSVPVGVENLNETLQRKSVERQTRRRVKKVLDLTFYVACYIGNEVLVNHLCTNGVVPNILAIECAILGNHDNLAMTLFEMSGIIPTFDTFQRLFGTHVLPGSFASFPCGYQVLLRMTKEYLTQQQIQYLLSRHRSFPQEFEYYFTLVNELNIPLTPSEIDCAVEAGNLELANQIHLYTGYRCTSSVKVSDQLSYCWSHGRLSDDMECNLLKLGLPLVLPKWDMNAYIHKCILEHRIVPLKYMCKDTQYRRLLFDVIYDGPSETSTDTALRLCEILCNVIK